MQAKRFMAHGQLASNLLRTPLQLEKYIGLLFNQGESVLALRLNSER